VHQDAEQVQELFGRAGTARENDDAVADADEGFQYVFRCPAGSPVR